MFGFDLGSCLSLRSSSRFCFGFGSAFDFDFFGSRLCSLLGLGLDLVIWI